MIRRWSLLAECLKYPAGEGFVATIEAAAAQLRVSDPDVAEVLVPFLGFVRATPETDLEEFYTRTFDINPLCTLEVGWQIHGDTYERGAFLVKVRGLLRDHDLSEGTELPDHLATLLPLLDRTSEEETRELRDVFALPAVIRMRRGFVSGSGEGNPYDAVLRAIETALRRETTLSSEILHLLERGVGGDKPSSAAGEMRFGPAGIPLEKGNKVVEGACGH
jgi:nitrate reductase assembly molybdenum cofactor insertion protein NarJ